MTTNYKQKYASALKELKAARKFIKAVRFWYFETERFYKKADTSSALTEYDKTLKDLK